MENKREILVGQAEGGPVEEGVQRSGSGGGSSSERGGLARGRPAKQWKNKPLPPNMKNEEKIQTKKHEKMLQMMKITKIKNAKNTKIKITKKSKKKKKRRKHDENGPALWVVNQGFIIIVIETMNPRFII